MDKNNFYSGFIITLVGSIFAGINIIIIIDINSFVSKAIPAPGTVINLVRSSSKTRGSSITVYKPVVKFTTKKGEPVTFKSQTGSNPPSFTKGQRVEVLYDPQNPQSAIVNDWFGIWGGSTIFIGITSLFFLCGGWLMFTSFSRKSKLGNY